MTAPDPQTLYAACRALESATGREIPHGIVERGGDLYIWGRDSYFERSVSIRNDAAAARILRDALWEAVREWGIQNFGFHVTRNTIVIARDEPDGSFNTLYVGNDLPAAAHAIAEWCKANRTTPV